MWGFFSLFYFLNLEKERDGGKASFKRVGLLSSSQFCILAWDWLTCWRQWFRMKWTHAFSFLVMVRILTLHFIKLTSGLLDSFFYLLHQIKCFGITSRMPSNSFKLKQCRKGKSGLKIVKVGARARSHGSLCRAVTRGAGRGRELKRVPRSKPLPPPRLSSNVVLGNARLNMVTIH